MTPRLRSRIAILISALLPLSVYVASLAGEVDFSDTGDFQTVPYILGIPYPTGFPGFVLAGWVWSHAVAFGNVAWRMNLLCAVACAATAGILAEILLGLGAGAAIATAGALLYAGAPLIWEHATAVDVHPVSFAVVALALAFALRWRRGGAPADAFATALAAGGALALDNTTILILPGVACIALTRRPPAGLGLRAAGAAALAVVVTYAYLPLRSAIVSARRLDPTLALGIPAGRPFWDDHHPAALAGFLSLVTGSDFSPQLAFADLVVPASLASLAGRIVPGIAGDLGDVVLVLALAGAIVAAERAPLAAIGGVLFGALPALFAAAYRVESNPERYEFAAYFIVLVAAGYAAARAGDLVRTRFRVAFAAAGTLLVVALLARDVQNERGLFADHSTGAVAFLERVQRLSPVDAIVIATWTYATPLAYRAYVERRLGSRIVLTANPTEHLARFRGWLATRPIVVVAPRAVAFPGFSARRLDALDRPWIYAVR